MAILLQSLPLQYPHTPKSTPWNSASGMALIMGTDRVLSNNRTKAAKKRMVNGVAGRNMAPAVPRLHDNAVGGVFGPVWLRSGREQEQSGSEA